MRGSLQSKLFVLVMSVTVLPFVALSILGYVRTRQMLLHSAEQNLRGLARLQATQFETYIREKKSMVRSVLGGHNRWVQSWQDALRKGDTQKIRRSRELLSHWLRDRQKQGNWRGIGIVSKQGHVLLSMGDSLPSSFAPVKSQKHAVDLVAVVHFSKASETVLRVRLVAATPSKTPLFMYVDVPFSPHMRFLREKQAPAFQGDIFLLDERKQIVCGSLDVKHLHSLFGQKKALPTDEHRRKISFKRHQTPKKEWMLGVVAPIREVGWTLFIELPERRALRALEQIRSRGLGIVLLSFIVLICAIAWIARRTVRPIQKLVEATSALSQGNFDLALPPASSDEIGALTRSFKQMSEELKTYYTQLESKVAERTLELEEAQQFSDLLFHAIPESILVTDRALRIVKANQQAFDLFGEDIVGKLCYHVFEGEGCTQSDCIAQEVLHTGLPQSSEDDVPHPINGELFHKDFYPIHDAKGDIIGVLESAKIITDQKTLMAQLIHQEKIAAVGLMASGVAHEIGNPLASISALVQRLLYKSNDPALRTTYEEIAERCALIARILETLNDYARKKPNRSVPLDVRQEVKKAIALVRFDKRFRKVQLKQEYAPELPLIWGREDALSQIITNLLLNALDAVQDISEPWIEIRVQPNQKGLILSIADNGHGVQQGFESKIFEPFFTTKDASKGTGLGLSICKQIVEQIGGSITARTRKPNGTCFDVRLPVESSSYPKES